MSRTRALVETWVDELGTYGFVAARVREGFAGGWAGVVTGAEVLRASAPAASLSWTTRENALGRQALALARHLFIVLRLGFCARLAYVRSRAHRNGQRRAWLSTGRTREWTSTPASGAASRRLGGSALCHCSLSARCCLASLTNAQSRPPSLPPAYAVMPLSSFSIPSAILFARCHVSPLCVVIQNRPYPPVCPELADPRPAGAPWALQLIVFLVAEHVG